jgi:hypothetical protein
MNKNLIFYEVVMIVSENKELKKFKGHAGIITGIAKNDDEDFIHHYRVGVYNDRTGYQDFLFCYPDDLVSLGKVAHKSFNESNMILGVRSDGEVFGMSESPEPFFIVMGSLIVFYYEEHSKRLRVTLKNEVLENNKSYEIINKNIFNKWDDGDLIPPENQIRMMKNFKESMHSRFGVEIDYE